MTELSPEPTREALHHAMPQNLPLRAANLVAVDWQLTFRDLAAKACPRRVKAAFFALLMEARRWWAVTSTPGWLGYTALVLISAAFTAAAWAWCPWSKSTASSAGGRRRGCRGAPSRIQVRSGATRLITRPYR
jgi:hypothetical protein